MCDFKMAKSAVIHNEGSILNNRNQKDYVTIGEYTHILGQLLVFGHGGEISIGDYCYIGHNTCIWSAEEISIGNRVLISHGCNIFDNNTHPIDKDERHQHFVHLVTKGFPKSQKGLNEKKIVIKDDVWIGANSIILKGVTISEGSIVAMGSLVTQDVPPNCIVAGNPAKIIKKIKI